jgi:exonuclease III
MHQALLLPTGSAEVPAHPNENQLSNLLLTAPPQEGRGKGRLTAPAPPRPPPIVEETEEELGFDPDFISDTTHMVVIKQAGDNRGDIRDSEMAFAITQILHTLEGVNTEPDIMDDGRKGPWTIFVNEDCALQFEAAIGPHAQLQFGGITYNFTVTYSSILDISGDSSSNQKANARAIASAFADISTHIVVRIRDPTIANRVGLGHIKAAMHRAGLNMIKGNRERIKIATSQGLLLTQGRTFVFHTYGVPFTGNTLGFKWPSKLLIEVPTPAGVKAASVDYAVRESTLLGGKDKNIVICNSLKGCKGYKPEMGESLISKGFSIRLCKCEAKKAEFNQRKMRRIETQEMDMRAVLGLTSPPKDCTRFLNGICLLNKKGKKCSSNHNIPGTWGTTAEGAQVCLLECQLNPHPTFKGLCNNGKECLYSHRAKYAPAPSYSHHHTPSHAIVYAHTFDATLGFPGEGPLTVASYNINGTRGSLAAVLAQAKSARIDILLLQELHFYEDGEHCRIGPLAERLGWTLVHSPATRQDPSSGVAIAVRKDSAGITPHIETARSIITSRYITMTCSINGSEQSFSSVYLSAQAPSRKAQIHTIARSKILKENAITGGDFNCVEDPDTDIRYPPQRGSTYANAGGKSLSRVMASSGMIDAYRLIHSDAKGGYTRLAHTVHTRIDRIYTKAHDSTWRWQQLGSPPTTFTGKAHSDHLPVIARLALAKERPPSETEAKIDPSIFDLPNIRTITTLIWNSQKAKYPHATHGHAKGWTEAKAAVAAFLLWESKEQRKKNTPTTRIKNSIRTTHEILLQNGPSPILTAKINSLNEELEHARKEFAHSSRTAKTKAAKEEILTKEFFASFKSRTNNGDIAELYITPTWEDPTHDQEITTDNDRIILRELRKYYSWLYSEKPSEENEAPLKALRERPLQQSDIELMERPVALYECKQAIRRLGISKAAGPDGLPAEFYRSFEELVVQDLYNTFLEAHAGGSLPPTMREGDIVLLYKKGDSRDPRNYRPITLLQVDYKILAKILVTRIKKVINNFVSKEQLGFVPKRLIGEASHLLKLVQAYLEEEGRDGLLLALDWEKAFDRVSWDYYHLALEALHFGPSFRGWARLLSNPEALPVRRIKANGSRSNPFTIKCGVPQGCPFSPLAFLIIAEALTRLIQNDPEIKGIEINEVHIKISQFADDTQLFAETYEDFLKALEWVRVYEKATGSKVNAHKYVGIQWGTQKRKPPPDTFKCYNWLRPGEYTKILGVPFWSTGENDTFWEGLYLKIKRRIANWRQLSNLSIIGRATLANFLIYSVPRYWAQTLAAPKWFHTCLEADVYQLLWERDPLFDVEDIGTDSNSYKWIKRHATPTTPTGDTLLGTGLIDWPSHIKAMQVKWLLKYLDASQSTWKLILDCWFSRTSLGRAAILSTIPVKTLSQSLRGNIALPLFWRQALTALRELTLSRTQLSLEGASSQPIWDNPHIPPPQIPPLFRDRWESLQVTVQHNLYSNLECTQLYTNEENTLYIDTETSFHYFQNKKINNDKFLDSFSEIHRHMRDHITIHGPAKKRLPPPKGGGEPGVIRITTDGEYVIFIEGTPFRGIQNSLGELAVGECLDFDHEVLDPSPPVRWGKGYKGPRREAFPLPEEYSLDGKDTPLDETSVRILTRTFSSNIRHKPHPSMVAWTQRLAINSAQWKIIATRYNNTFLTPRDYHLHFKHITHRRIATNNRYKEEPPQCRFCHKHTETSVHLGNCPALQPIFRHLNKIAEFTPAKKRNSQQRAKDNLFCFPDNITPPCIPHLYMIAWRYIITDFYQLKYNNDRPPFDPAQALDIYRRTLGRYIILALAKSHHVRTLLLRRSNTSDPLPIRLIRRTNKTLSPLLHLCEGDAKIYKSANFAKHLAEAKCDHLGRNIPLKGNQQ